MLIKFHKNQFPAPCITIASTTLNLLEWIQEKSKVGHIKSKKNYNPQKHKDSYTYIVKYEDAIYLLKAQMIIYEYKQVTPRNGKYSKELLQQKEDFYKRFISI